MIGTTDDPFFETVPLSASFSALTDFDRYVSLPDHWILCVGDVVESRSAIGRGMYKEVNIAGASVITSLTNALGSRDYPFIFGGDGAIIALPGHLVDIAHETLANLKAWVSEALQLEMRVAIVPMMDVKAAGYDVRIARYRASSNVIYAMFAGGGSSWIEKQVKSGKYCINGVKATSRPNLTGLSCRWHPIASTHGEIVSLIVTPGPNGASHEFTKLLDDILAIIEEQSRSAHPLPADGPPLRLAPKGVAVEARATAPKKRLLLRKLVLLIESAFALCIDFLALPVGSFKPKQYKIEIAENSDYRKFDDGLKMTIDVAPERSRRIEKALIEGERRGLCRFGIHRQDQALMTCFAPSLQSRDHIHFIDGAEGGYALAAINMDAGRGEK